MGAGGGRMDSIQVGAEEGTAVGGELLLNRWFISRLQDLQPSLPTRAPPASRAEEPSRDQMFPLSHHRWRARRHGGREREGNQAEGQIPSLGTLPPPRGSASWSLCPLEL